MTQATTDARPLDEENPGTITGPPCAMPRCGCTHTAPCDRGWIDDVDTTGATTSTRPCPTCRPDLARIIATSWSTEERSNRLALRSRSIAAEG